MKEPDEDKTDKGAGGNEADEQERSHDDEDIDEKKKGERPGNLGRRSDWFQKRHGGGDG